MLSLTDKNTKLVVLVVATVGVVWGLSLNKKALGKKTTLVGTGLVVVVAMFFGMSLLKEDEGFGCAAANNGREEFYGGGEEGECTCVGPCTCGKGEEVEEGFQGDGEVEARNETALQQNSVESNENDVKATGCIPLETLKPGELLPDANSDNIWDTPANPGDISGANFLDAGYHIGVNTVGQSLRNANRQIRSEPPNPQVKVSPWLQTTIEPDSNRRPLEIGA